MKKRNLNTVYKTTVLLTLICSSLLAQEKKTIYCDSYKINNQEVVEQDLTMVIWSEETLDIAIPDLVDNDYFRPYKIHITKWAVEYFDGRDVLILVGKLNNGSTILIALSKYFIEVYLEDTKTTVVYRIDQLKMNSKNG